MPIKSFRAKMTDATVDRIPLHTNNGSIGYRIVKFEMMSENPGVMNHEAVIKIYKTPQTGVTSTVDFSDQTMLAAGELHKEQNHAYPVTSIIIFDREVFNQDIYITLQDGQNNDVNYYIELEQIKLDLAENTVATLKDIRNIASESI